MTHRVHAHALPVVILLLAATLLLPNGSAFAQTGQQPYGSPPYGQDAYGGQTLPSAQQSATGQTAPTGQQLPGQPTPTTVPGPSGQPAQGTTVQISIDTPTDGARVGNGTEINIGGWAVDSMGIGTGIDAVRVYLDELMGVGPAPIGTADYGSSRPDVAATLGNTAWVNSGFNLSWTPTSQMPGTHTLYVYAHSRINGWMYSSVTVTLQGHPGSGFPVPNGPPSYQGVPCVGPPGNPCGSPPYPPPPPVAPGPPCILIYPPPPGC